MPNQDTNASLSSGNLSSGSLLDVLLSDHLITPAQADEIKEKSASLNKPYEDSLVSLSLVSSEKLAEVKAKLYGVPFISLASFSFSPLALSMIPRAVAERFRLIPFLFDEKTRTLSIAMANPVDLEALEFVRQKTGLDIKIFATSEDELKKVIDQQYKQGIVGEVGKAIKETTELTKPRKNSTRSSNITYQNSFKYEN